MRRCGAEWKGEKTRRRGGKWVGGRCGRVGMGGRVAVAGPLLLWRTGDRRLSRVQIATAPRWCAPVRVDHRYLRW